MNWMVNRELTLLIIIALVFFSFLYLFPLIYWMMARYSGLKISIFSLFVMRIKRISVKKFINAIIMAKKGNLKVRFNELEQYHIKGGDVTNVVIGLLAATTANIPLTIREAIEYDQQGINIYDQIKKLTETRGISS